MKEKIKAFFAMKYSFLLVVILGLAAFTALSRVFREKKESRSMWKEISNGEAKKQPKEWLSNYEKLKMGLMEQPDRKSRLLQGEEILERRNFKTSAEETTPVELENNPQSKAGKAKKYNKATKIKEEEGSFNITNPEFVREETKYKAVFRESQDIRPDKHVQIVLEDGIYSLNLEPGTILYGLPSLVGGRIHIKITSAKVGGKLMSLSTYGLVCLDDPSLAVGIYNDDVAKMFAEASKKSLARELLGFGPDEVTSRIEKGMSLAEITKSITIEKGKQLFVALPPKKTDKNGND